MADELPSVEDLKRFKDDFAYYAEKVLRIQDKDAELVPFKLNRAQRRIDAMVQEDLAAGKPVRMYILKARQLGFSTYVQGRLYHLVSLNKNRNALVAAHDIDSANALFLKSQTFYKACPDPLRPMLRISNRQELHFANPDQKASSEEMGLESRIIVKTAANRNLGASMTLHGLHLSEFAKYEKVLQEVKISMATVLQTVPRRRGTMVFLETTADGMGYAKDVWDSQNGYRKVFVSWVADETYTSPIEVLRLTVKELQDTDDSLYGNEVWVRERIVDELKFWYPEHANDAEWLATESLCRLQFRREMIQDQFGGDPELFRQEYPITAEEAFLTSGTAVFDQRKVSDLLHALQVRDEDGRFVSLKQPPTHHRYDPHQREFYEAPHGELRVYEDAVQGGQYVIGADVSEGYASGDYSVAQVLKLPYLVQVATWEGQIDPDSFADVLFALGKRYNWAWLAPEVNGPGLATVLKLSRTQFYPAMYTREVFDHRNTKQFQQKVGWQTNRQTKALLVNSLRSALREDLIVLKDVKTLKDMSLYTRFDEDKFGAPQGEHDDTVMALGMAYQMAEQVGVAYMRQKPVEVAVAADSNSGAPHGSFEWWADHTNDEMNAALADEQYRARYGF